MDPAWRALLPREVCRKQMPLSGRCQVVVWVRKWCELRVQCGCMLTVMSIVLVSGCARESDMQTRRMVDSPSGDFTAVIKSDRGDGPLGNVRYEIIVEGHSDRTRPPGSPGRVWSAFGIAPVGIRWVGEESLLVVIPAEQRARYVDRDPMVRRGVRPFVGIEWVSAVSESGGPGAK